MSKQDDRMRAERFLAQRESSVTNNALAWDRRDWLLALEAEFAAIRAPLEAEIERLKGEVASRMQFKYRGRVPSMLYDLDETC